MDSEKPRVDEPIKYVCMEIYTFVGGLYPFITYFFKV